MKNTNTEERILDLLFDFPLTVFSLREVSRKLKISPPAVSKALKQLERKRLILLEKGFLYKIQANIENSDFKNLKRVSNLRRIYSSGLFSYFNENFPFNGLILFGSYSFGEDTEKSDIDIAIDRNEKKLELEKYEKILNRRINLEFIDFKKISKELKNNILNGIVLSGHIII